MYESLLIRKAEELSWLYVDESVLSPNKGARQRWIDNHQILCKVGMTTKPSVDTRLLEWQNTCKHAVLNLTPQRVDVLCNRQDSTKGLTKMFEKLAINTRKAKKKAPSALKLNLRTYQNGGFFFDGRGDNTLQEIENAIHKLLWRKYGQGLIYCHGCDPSGQKRHKEWFRVKIAELPWLLRTLDEFCFGGLP